MKVICRLTGMIAAAALVFLPEPASAQQDTTKKDVRSAVAAAATAINATPETVAPAPRPVYWAKSMVTRINFDQTKLTNWKAGGINNVTLNAYIDANANYAKDKTFWNNRLQLDYGFIYQEGHPFIQKNTDRIYFESKWGHRATERLNYSAQFNFKSQFTKSYDYVTPKSDGENEPTKADWMAARKLRSGFMAPANVNVALGVDWVPNPKNKWLVVNFAPLTGGFTIVSNESLRKTNGMKRKKAYEDEDAYPYQVKDGAGNIVSTHGEYYRAAKFEFGSQLKVDLSLRINQNFTYGSQLLLFSDYLDNPQNIRVNWDNRVSWLLAKYFTFSISTFLIYDDNVFIVSDKRPDGSREIQFKELVGFGFTYTFPVKK